ncbi:MAG: hypothetical protein R3E83_21435 [Burkholderiaceae bacterium]
MAGHRRRRRALLPLRWSHPASQRASKLREGGQALIEMLLAGALLTLLALMIIMLGRLFSIDAAASGAARTAAFECAMRPQACAGRVAAAPHGQAASHFSAGDDQAGDQQFWHDHRGRGLVDTDRPFKLQSVPTGLDAGRGLLGAGRIGAAGARLVDRLAGPSRFGLDLFGGLHTQSVEVPIWQARPADAALDPVSGFRMSLSARSAILIDSWQARSSFGAAPDTVSSRVASGATPPLWHERVPGLAHIGTHAFMTFAHVLAIDADPDALIGFDLDPSLIPPDREPR